jgi:hypothetical protein
MTSQFSAANERIRHHATREPRIRLSIQGKSADNPDRLPTRQLTYDRMWPNCEQRMSREKIQHLRIVVFNCFSKSLDQG